MATQIDIWTWTWTWTWRSWCSLPISSLNRNVQFSCFEERKDPKATAATKSNSLTWSTYYKIIIRVHRQPSQTAWHVHSSHAPYPPPSAYTKSMFCQANLNLTDYDYQQIFLDWSNQIPQRRLCRYDWSVVFKARPRELFVLFCFVFISCSSRGSWSCCGCMSPLNL